MPEIRANLLHLGMAMWRDRDAKLACEDAEWRFLTDRMAAKGFNMVIVDLGEGVKYDCRPELAANGAWSIGKLRSELARLHSIGLEPVPKLNFSAAHDAWLGEWSRMLSTPEYYGTCAALIREVAEIFDHPRLMHIGYDEEDVWNQADHQHVCMRQSELWWHDLLWFVKTVEDAGMRTWIWSDWIWEHREDFLRRMPRSVLQSNWYYDDMFDPRAFRWPRVAAYTDLARHGFDQVPTASNCVCSVNAARTVEFCRKNIPAEKLKGFMQTSWKAVSAANREANVAAIDLMAATWGK